MLKRILVVALLLASLGSACPLAAEELTVKPDDSIVKLLEGYRGKRVTIRLQGSDELTGKVRSVGRELVHLGELSGREFFDAAIDVRKISAVIVRVKTQ